MLGGSGRACWQAAKRVVRACVGPWERILLTTLQVLGVAAVALTDTLCAWGPWLPKWIQMGVMDGRLQRPLLAFRILVVSFSCYSSSRVRTRALPDDCGHRLVLSGGLCRQGACSEATTRLASVPLRLANFNWILVSFAFLFLSYFLLTHSLTVYSSTVLSDCLELVEGLVCPASHRVLAFPAATPPPYFLTSSTPFWSSLVVSLRVGSSWWGAAVVGVWRRCSGRRSSVARWRRHGVRPTHGRRWRSGSGMHDQLVFNLAKV